MEARRRGRPPLNKSIEEKQMSERERLREYYAVNKDAISQRRKLQYQQKKLNAAN